MFKISVNKLFTSQCSPCWSDHSDCVNTTFVLKPVEITSGSKTPRSTYNTEHENPETDHTAGTREEAPKTRKRFTVTKFEIKVL